MLMRILIPFIILSCIVCCRTKELRIPDQSDLSHLAAPVFLKSDTTWVDLKDYFLYPEKIKKILMRGLYFMPSPFVYIEG